MGSIQNQGQHGLPLLSQPQRRDRSRIIRIKAAEHAFDRGVEKHCDNGDEDRFEQFRVASFTKGLPHDPETGLLYNPRDFDLFVRSIDTGAIKDQKAVPLGPPEGSEFCSGIAKMPKMAAVRAWESSGAGHTFDLQGADAQSVTMPPAPTIDSKELVTEMTEVYSMALMRDLPFSEYEDPSTATYRQAQMAIRRLNATVEDENMYNVKNLFRGVFRGDNVGPYVSQFLLVGTTGLDGQRSVRRGIIDYGSTRIDQRVRVAEFGKDYMTTWKAFIDVQNGANLGGRETYEQAGDLYRFITSPRDMATYVHYDALYQAYLNACLILLGMGVKFDDGIPFQKPDSIDKQQGFAHWGGPHILALVTEVSTRALKAVRYQKFNVHRRLRPEAVGGLVHRYKQDHDSELYPIKDVAERLDQELLDEIAAHNAEQNEIFSDRTGDGNVEPTYLLPMAFAEGSPMHPSYGAGHATVAGACVTILKAFFDHKHKLAFAYQPDSTGHSLEEVRDVKGDLTVEGELNKLAANISIGRNMAGVHYFSDYLESMLLGEKIAISILEEQALTYNEDFSMTIPSFRKADGDVVIEKEGCWVYTRKNGQITRKRSPVC